MPKMVMSMDIKAEELQHTMQLNTLRFKLHTAHWLQKHTDMTLRDL